MSILQDNKQRLIQKLGLSLSPATIGSAGFDVSACIEEEITLAGSKPCTTWFRYAYQQS